VFPYFSITNRSNVPPRDPIFIGEHLICKFINSVSTKFCISDFYNLIFCEDGASGSFSKSVSSFRNFVIDVINVSPKKKMIWSYARSIVTFMKNPKSLRDIFIVENPRYSMGTMEFSTTGEVSISTSMSSSFPNPASAGFFDEFPKSSIQSIYIVLKNFIVIVLHWISSFIRAVCTSWSPMMIIIQRNSCKKEKTYGCK
jgi:hypothetical protein